RPTATNTLPTATSHRCSSTMPNSARSCALMTLCHTTSPQHRVILSSSMRRPAERCSIALIAILVVATVVRFAGLGSKPLWIDEAMTALVVLGRGPADVPLGVASPLTALASIFSLDPAATWLDVVTRLVDPSVQHTHPPLFYVLMHAWVAWLAPPLSELAWTLRAVAAVFGVLAVVLIFGLARSAFVERAGLIAAALAAVSPAVGELREEGG